MADLRNDTRVREVMGVIENARWESFGTMSLPKRSALKRKITAIMANPHPRIDQIVATQFKPGNPGGPGGKRKRPMSEANDDLLRLEIPAEMLDSLNMAVVHGVKKNMKILKPGATWADAIAYGLVKKALLGEVPAAKELRESVEGKSTQRIELISHEDRQVELSVVFEQAIAPRNPNVDRVIERRTPTPMTDAAKKMILAAAVDEDADT